jgi:hypothetical protein
MFPTNMPAVIKDQTVRQVARVSVGGACVRIVLSNTYGAKPIAVGKATLGLPVGEGAVAADSIRAVTFGGREAAVILPGASLLSDPVALPIRALSQVAVSVHLPTATAVQSFHWDGRQTG